MRMNIYTTITILIPVINVVMGVIHLVAHSIWVMGNGYVIYHFMVIWPPKKDANKNMSQNTTWEKNLSFHFLRTMLLFASSFPPRNCWRWTICEMTFDKASKLLLILDPSNFVWPSVWARLIASDPWHKDNKVLQVERPLRYELKSVLMISSTRSQYYWNQWKSNHQYWCKINNVTDWK